MSNQISRPALGTKENPILISEYSEVLSLNKNFKIKFKCEVCSKEVSLLVKTILNYNGKLLCPHHHQEEILMEKYGVKNISQIESVKEKKKETTIKHFGVDNPSKSKEIIKKIQRTNFEKYGHICNLDSEKGIQQKKETWIKKYGVDSPMKSDKVVKNLQKVFQEKYGYLTPLEKEENRRQKFYKYDNQKFDSSWELYFYIYNKDLGKNIIRNSKDYFSYEKNGKIRRYFPDFKIDNEYYEIKGPQFFNENNEPTDYFGNDWSEKYNCIISNKVHIITEISKFQKYVESKYSLDFISKYKIIYNQSQ